MLSWVADSTSRVDAPEKGKCSLRTKTFLTVLASLLTMLYAPPASAQSLIDLQIDSFCPSTTHLVKVSTSAVDSPHFVTIVGQVHVNNTTWTNSGSAETVGIATGATETFTKISIPPINGEHDYRVRVTDSDLSGARGKVSNGVDCHAFTPTATPTSIPTATPTATPTSIVSTPSATTVPTATSVPTSTSTAVSTATSAPPAVASSPVPTLTPTVVAPSSVPTSGPSATVQPFSAAIIHTASYEYVCVVSNIVDSNDVTTVHIDVVRTSDANGYLAEHPSAFRMPKAGCGPTDTVVVIPTSTPVPALPTATIETAVVVTPSVTPVVEGTPLPQVSPAPTPSLTEEAVPTPTEEATPKLPPVQIPPDIGGNSGDTRF